MKRHNKKWSGFTIVELIVVISVIAILAGIVIVSYGAWRHGILESQVKSDLVSAAGAMESARGFGDGYPSSIPTTFTASDNVTITLPEATNESFCIDGVSTEDETIQFYIDQRNTKEAQAGTCIERILSSAPATPTNIVVGAATGSGVPIEWDAVAGAASYTAQCATDPAYIYDVVESTVTGTSTMVTGLNPSTSVYCRVKATNAVGSGEWSP